MSADFGNEHCAACGKPADAELMTFNSPLCLPCSAAWCREAPEREAVRASLLPGETFAGRMAKWTATWAAKRRKNARAA